MLLALDREEIRILKSWAQQAMKGGIQLGEEESLLSMLSQRSEGDFEIGPLETRVLAYWNDLRTRNPIQEPERRLRVKIQSLIQKNP